MTCPSWCEVDHELDLEVEVPALVHSQRIVGGQLALVAIDDLRDADREPTMLVATAMVTSAEQARALALAILEAGDHLGSAP